MKTWHETIILTKGSKIKKYSSLDEVCRDNKDFDCKELSKEFPFIYKGWDFNKVQYRTKAE